MKTFLLCLSILPMMLFAPAHSGGQEGTPSSRFVVSYFYTSVRCPSCVTIERLTSETIEGEFFDEIKNGVLLWRTVNIEEEGNFHYVEDYNLYTKSVILSEMSGDKEVRWKNLGRVWELLGNEGSFRRYVKSEVKSFMEHP